MMGSSKATDILNVGQALIQTKGYAGFSFRDVADEVGIKSASVHYHFPTKADLAVAATQRYRDAFGTHLDAIRTTGGSCRDQLKQYAGLYSAALGGGRLCLCGMLATGSDLLPERLRTEVDLFFFDQTAWIEGVLSSGVRTGELASDLDVPLRASLLVATLEGAMIIARNRGANDHDLSYVVDAIVP